MRISQKISLSAATVVLTMLAGTTPALAETHPFVSSFGSFTNPNGIAVEESTGDVYVADLGTKTVYRFDASGNPVNFPALGTNALTHSFSFPAVYGTPAAIAVDNSTSPSDPSRGDLYVMDAGHNVIDKFSPTGAYLSQITGPFEVGLRGLALTADGELRVAVQLTPAGGTQQRALIEAIDLFDNSTANNLTKQQEGGTGLAHFDSHIYESLEDRSIPPEDSFAVSPTGDYYTLFECGCAEKFGGALSGLGRVDSGPGDVAMAVDPVSGHLYLDDQSSIVEWDTGGLDGYQYLSESFEDVATGATVSSFGSLQLAGASAQQGGIAVNGASGEIYVSNPADGKVYVFASTPPGVAAGTAANVSETSATLQGSIDPRGVPVTSCEFEYEKAHEADREDVFSVPATTFAHSVSCAQTTTQIGSGTNPVGVSADISGLAPGVLYHFRLVGGNADGTSPSEGMFAAADAGFGISDFSVSFLNQDGTPDIQAGSHPYEMVTSFTFNTKAAPTIPYADSVYRRGPVGNAKDIIFTPPPGLVGNPNATGKKCKLTELDQGEVGVGGGEEFETGCPHESKVGEMYIETNGYGTGTYVLYNMVAPHGVAAQFGTRVVFPDAFINAGAVAGGQYPIQTESINIPTIVPINRVRVRLLGVVGSGENRVPFLTLPTGCTGPLRSTITADSYQHPGDYVSKSDAVRNAGGELVRLSGCSQLTFPAAVTVAPDVTNASSSSGLTVGVHVPQTAALNPEGLGESALRDTTVALPAGVAINPAGADGLQACSEGLAGFTGFTEFNQEFEPGVKTFTFTPTPIEALQPGVSFCPDGAKIGTARIKTPLLPNALEGAVYLATQNENPFGSLIAMYMFMEDPVSGSTVKLAGEVRLCENTGELINGVSCQGPGQIVTTFKNTPDLPFEDLELHFFGGERAPLSTPSRCGTYTTQASFTPWDGNSPVNTSSSFQITSGPNGGPCPGASLPFAPTLTAGTASIQAGGFSPFTMTMSRPDGSQNLQAISLRMPPGLSGLLAGVELCPEPQADQGTCGPSSQIGETIVSVGVGGKPFSVKGGKVFITGPYGGAPFGLSIVNPAKAGPFDLEQGTPCDCVVVRAKIEVDPITAALTITSDNSGPYKIPTILDGIPLEIQHVNVTVNRPGFTFNPTNCNPMAITGSLSSTEGATDALSVPFQATNCAVLGFKPGFKVSTSGKTSRANGASLSVKLTYPKAPFGSQANIRSVKVNLPKQLVSRLSTLQNACLDSVFNANPASCPSASRIGTAKAVTPLIPVPLTGPVYFVSHGGAKFPELIVVLSGYGVTVQLHSETFISKAGITSSTFRTIPDVPVGTFELTLPEGKYSALAANGNLCKVKGGIKMPTAFTAQNGAVIHQSTPISVTGCPKHKKAKKK